MTQERLEPGSILKFIEQVYFNGQTLGSLPCNYSYYEYYTCNLGCTDGTETETKSVGDGKFEPGYSYNTYDVDSPDDE